MLLELSDPFLKDPSKWIGHFRKINPYYCLSGRINYKNIDRINSEFDPKLDKHSGITAADPDQKEYGLITESFFLLSHAIGMMSDRAVNLYMNYILIVEQANRKKDFPTMDAALG